MIYLFILFFMLVTSSFKDGFTATTNTTTKGDKKMSILYKGFIIELNTFINGSQSFEVIGNYENSKYNSFNGFIEQISNNQYKIHTYLHNKQCKSIFIDKYVFKTFNECIQWIKHHIDVLI